MTRLFALLLALTAMTACAGRSQADSQSLVLEQTIALPGVVGRIDHLAIDLVHNRLFIAEIANGSVDVIDLKAGDLKTGDLKTGDLKTGDLKAGDLKAGDLKAGDLKAGRVIKHITGLHEPQGLAYLPAQDVFVVSCGGDGTVRFYRGADFAPVATLENLDDADNLRLDPATGNIVVGYGSGALAVIDPLTRQVLATIALPSHPEGFQIDPATGRTYVNLPRSLKIAVVDLPGRKLTALWKAGKALENFPMAIDPAHRVVASGYRVPGRFIAFDTASGTAIADRPACGETDDLIYDAGRDRYYLLCGDGRIDIFGGRAADFKALGQVTTEAGGRTGLFSAEQDRLFIAVAARHGQAAALRIYRPA